ncbi:MAG: hypothetical protein IJO61_06945 [Oscillospiraceae bacterium]|nr:hypothetical protein [Oscillospiraceae bacterium]
MKPEKKKKRNVKKIIIIVLCVLAVLAVAGYFIYDAVMYYIGDTVMRELAKNEIANAVENGSITEEELRIMAGEIPAPKPQENAETGETDATADGGETKADAATSSEEKGTQQQKPEASKPQTKPQSQPQTKQKMSEKEKNALVDKATDNVANFVSREDKVAMAKLITSRLSSSDISYLAGLLGGGLTREERSAAYKIAVARFHGDELNQVSRFYHKYKSQIMSEPDLVPN